MQGHEPSDAQISPLSGGMIFIALCLNRRSYTVKQLAEPFRRFQNTSKRISQKASARKDELNAADVYLEKAARYACLCLEALGMAQSFGGDEFTLTRYGRELLESDKLRSRHEPSYRAFEVVMKK